MFSFLLRVGGWRWPCTISISCPASQQPRLCARSESYISINFFFLMLNLWYSFMSVKATLQFWQNLNPCVTGACCHAPLEDEMSLWVGLDLLEVAATNITSWTGIRRQVLVSAKCNQKFWDNKKARVMSMIARKLQWLVLRQAICEAVPTLSKLTLFFFKVNCVKEVFFYFYFSRWSQKKKKRVAIGVKLENQTGEWIKELIMQ